MIPLTEWIGETEDRSCDKESIITISGDCAALQGVESSSIDKEIRTHWQLPLIMDD